MSNPIITEVVEQMEHLPDNLQQQVLEFVYKLKVKVFHPVWGPNGRAAYPRPG